MRPDENAAKGLQGGIAISAASGSSEPDNFAASAASDAARSFSRIDEFMEAWEPLTAWGKDDKNARLVYRDREKIEELLDLAEAWVGLQARFQGAGREASLDRIAFHLGRLPRLPEPFERKDASPGVFKAWRSDSLDGGLDDNAAPHDDAMAVRRKGTVDSGAAGPSLDRVELFALRKFATNYKKIASLLDDRAIEAFGFPPLPEDLERAFASLGSDGESFHLADACDPGLLPIRERLGEIDAALKAERCAREGTILAMTGIDIAGRDFVLTSRSLEMLGDATDRLFDVEVWDGKAHVLRPRPGLKELALGDERASLLVRENAIEAEVMASMSARIRGCSDGLSDCVSAVARLDGARSRAMISSSQGFTRPRFAESPDAPIEIEAGRLVPLEIECAAAGMRYAALDLRLPERAATIFGSNMGGKTVTLKTLLFLQILAQSGFKVPASAFSVPIFPVIDFIGEGSVPANDGGLSGFGREIRSLIEARRSTFSGGLLAFDEFARTTSSAEAEALLAALLQRFAAEPGIKALFATHFRAVARVEGARRLRMRGLDREGARALGDAGKTGPSGDPGVGAGERAIAGINSLMRYELVEDMDDDQGSDALLVAGLLGLDPGIVASATAFYEGAQHRNGAPREGGFVKREGL